MGDSSSRCQVCLFPIAPYLHDRHRRQQGLEVELDLVEARKTGRSISAKRIGKRQNYVASPAAN
jgi:hypothetical protein